jgi:hypothetical protein
MPDAPAHCKTRAQPRGYGALRPNRILRTSSSVERSAFRRPRTSTTRALPALDPTDARLVARQTRVHDAEQAIDLLRMAIDREGIFSGRRGPAIGPSPPICQKQPFGDGDLLARRIAAETAALVREILQDPADSKTEIGAPSGPSEWMIAGLRLLGGDREKARLELLAASDDDRTQVVRQPALLGH